MSGGMGVFEMIVMVVFFGTIARTIERVTVAKAKARSEGHELVLAEVRQIREEVRELRQRQNDMVLAFDTSLTQLTQRVQSLETRANAAQQESVLLGGRT